ncbi:hypothetical protein [Synechococcus sp. MIT S1220]|uniref:hypothetical protein n=1 Tax=Synechococcus sp. MIT S1220 TaxID=3082549 RepID=UPI0039B0901E
MAPKQQPGSSTDIEMGGAIITGSKSGKNQYDIYFIEPDSGSDIEFPPIHIKGDAKTEQAKTSATASALYSMATGTLNGAIGNTAGAFSVSSVPSTGKVKLISTVVAIGTGYIASEGWQSSVEEENDNFGEDLAVTIGSSLLADAIVTGVGIAGGFAAAPIVIGAGVAAGLGYGYYWFKDKFFGTPNEENTANYSSTAGNGKDNPTTNPNTDSTTGQHGEPNGGAGYGYELGAPPVNSEGGTHPGGGSGGQDQDPGPDKQAESDGNCTDWEYTDWGRQCSIDNYRGDLGGDSSTNPEDQNSSDGPKIPAKPPGDVGGKYFDILNPGSSQGYRPSPDSNNGDGPDGPRPWDLGSRINSDDDYGCDPVNGPTDNSGGTEGNIRWNFFKLPPKKGGFGDSGGGFDDNYLPNPEDDWGVNGPNAKSLKGMMKRQIYDQIMDFQADTVLGQLQETGHDDAIISGARQNKHGDFQFFFDLDGYSKASSAKKNEVDMVQVVTGFMDTNKNVVSDFLIETMAADTLSM